jgi:hypothetical protein
MTPAQVAKAMGLESYEARPDAQVSAVKSLATRVRSRSVHQLELTSSRGTENVAIQDGCG